jgi:hypothetical protein
MQVCADQRRTPQRREYAAGLCRLAGCDFPDHRAQFRRRRGIFGKAARQGPNEGLIAIAGQDLEARQATFAQARAVSLDSCLLRMAHLLLQYAL